MFLSLVYSEDGSDEFITSMSFDFLLILHVSADNVLIINQLFIYHHTPILHYPTRFVIFSIRVG
jgi:hypothetical protein